MVELWVIGVFDYEVLEVLKVCSVEVDDVCDLVEVWL